MRRTFLVIADTLWQLWGIDMVVFLWSSNGIVRLELLKVPGDTVKLVLPTITTNCIPNC